MEKTVTVSYNEFEELKAKADIASGVVAEVVLCYEHKMLFRKDAQDTISKTNIYLRKQFDNANIEYSKMQALVRKYEDKYGTIDKGKLDNVHAFFWFVALIIGSVLGYLIAQ